MFFSWNSAFSMIQWMLAIWSLVLLPFLSPFWTFASSWFRYCWSLAWRILSITLLVREMSAVLRQVEHFLAFPFFGIQTKTDLFHSCEHCWVFQICWHIGCSILTAWSFSIWNSSTGIVSPPLDLFIVMLSKHTWFRIPGCLALGEWSHYRGYLVLWGYSCYLFFLKINISLFIF